MLTALRNGSDNWFVKAFLGIVVLGFIATGGLLSYSSVQSNNHVANIGEISVTADEFYADYSREVNRYSQQLGQNLESPFLKFIEQSVVDKLISSATLENAGKMLNLAIDDAEAVKVITADNNFKATNGEFNKAIFEGLLRSNNLTEKNYVALIKQQQLLVQLTQSISNIAASPTVYADIINEFNNEQRAAEFFYLKPSHVKIGDVPTGADLNTYYQTVIAQFDAPEYREVELLTLDPVELAKSLDVDAVEVKQLYELSKSAFNSPESRAISQLIYNNMDEANAAYEQAQNGTSFAALAVAKGVINEGYKLGTFAKSGLPNKKMAEIAFLLETDEISAPVDLGVSVALLQVTQINPAINKSFEDVRQQLEEQEALRLAIDKAYDLRDAVEDEIAGGATFAEIAKKLQLDARFISSINNLSQNLAKSKVDLPDVPGILGAILSTDELLDNEPLDTANGGLIWYKVNKITARKNLPLADVAADVIELWRNTETSKALLAKAEQLVGLGGELEALSKGISDEIQTALPVTRTTQSMQLSANAIAALFDTKINGFVYVAGRLNGEAVYLIMQLKDIIAPATTAMSEADNNILLSIAPDLQTALIESYIENDKTLYGISVNQPLIDRLTGSQTTGQ
ncbi:MAG: SurA N-terminal domain-containing protein [Rhizobiales bacterium]|nr:SurA N-terminal domain-containing protein [Hyphomicrobiales bacterium]NRB14849.1 SurA N-terminal domain-containing protein [Hyphomicrobiales bacterium]